METIYLVEGWTAPIDWQLLLDAAVPATALSGSITLVAYDRHGDPLTMPGTFTITSAADWKVRYTPSSATDLLNANSPMKVRTKLADGSFVPDGAPDKWVVSKP